MKQALHDRWVLRHDRYMFNSVLCNIMKPEYVKKAG